MGPDPFTPDLLPGWEVARPRGGTPFDGVDMAGFRDRDAMGLDSWVLPQPAVTVVFEFGGDSIGVEQADGSEMLGGLAAGMSPGPTRIRGRRVHCVEVRLSPVTAYSTLGLSPTDREGRVIDLTDLWGRQEQRLREQLAAASGWEGRFTLLSAFLAERVGSGMPVDPEVAAVWRHIVARRGRVRVNDLAQSCGWSRKRLWSRFGTQIGMTPKRAAMLVRFDRAARGLSAGRDPAEVAAVCGYADQSHMHRDVRDFAGITPRALRAPGALSAPGTSTAPGTSGTHDTPGTPGTPGAPAGEHFSKT
ncbi:helix-turn-helix domain-containing protein [Streptomyces alboniger]|uniref:AraC family transcriptional regulator n=1 Tax=Streptomyces alboniger TaxID=132473 RepID=A0A5J6HS60_STRAD|nr:AraC family transcriptional regulator [Streptomyces alboniger]QEV21181.1 AraC family transcriptional regulator [Streptomyces alboniger]